MSQLLWFLLTSTVRPQAGVTVVVGDERARRQQYVVALAHWIRAPMPDARIVFVENSGEDLDRVADDALGGVGRRRPVLISAPPPNAERGKGAAEATMIDFAFSQLDGLRDGDLLFKVTGRLYIRNARRVIPTACDIRHIILRGTMDWSTVDTRFFGASVGVWRQYFRAMEEEIDERDGLFLEHVVARRALSACWRDGVAIRRFSARPRFVGYSATTGKNYGGVVATVQHWTSAPLEVLMRRAPAARPNFPGIQSAELQPLSLDEVKLAASQLFGRGFPKKQF